MDGTCRIVVLKDMTSVDDSAVTEARNAALPFPSFTPKAEMTLKSTNEDEPMNESHFKLKIK